MAEEIEENPPTSDFGVLIAARMILPDVTVPIGDAGNGHRPDEDLGSVHFISFLKPRARPGILRILYRGTRLTLPCVRDAPGWHPRNPGES